MTRATEKFAEQMNELEIQIKQFLDCATGEKWSVKAEIDLWDCEIRCEVVDPVIGEFLWLSPYVELIRYEDYVKRFGPYERAVEYAQGVLYGLFHRRIKHAKQTLGFVMSENTE